MPFSFPSSPTVGQQSVQNGRTFSWTGYVWEIVPSAEDARWDYFKPAAPTGVTAVAANAQAVVSWTAPAALVPPLTDYTVQFSINGGSTWTTANDSVSNGTSATITGLSNNVATVFRVAGVNGIGTGAYSTASAAVTPTAGDPLFNNVALLLPMDGTGSTFFDSSATPKTITAVGGATQSSTQSKWGGKSLALDGSTANLSLPSAGFSFTGDFVIEAWVYLNSVTTYATIAETRSSPSYSDFICGVYDVGGVLRPDFVTVGGGGARLTGSSTVVPLNQWAHIAFVRNSGVLSAYVNGTRDSTQINYSATITPASATMLIGRNVDGNFVSGYIDDLRITVGNNRGYTGSTITVPVAAFPDLGPPPAPTSLTASAGNAQISLAWTAPASNGGSAITGYTVEYTPSGGSAQTVSTGSTSTSYTLTGLTNGTAYTVKVAAANAVGTGAYSAGASGTPNNALLAISGSDTANWTGFGTASSKFSRFSAVGESACDAFYGFTFEALGNATFRAVGTINDQSGDADNSVSIQIWNSAMSSVVSTLYSSNGSFNVSASISSGQKVRFRKSCWSSGTVFINGGVTVWAE